MTNEKEYTITICRKSYVDFTVNANTKEEAINKAFDEAYNMNWTEEEGHYAVIE